MDARVVAFAARRPVSDRRRLGEGKRILRRSMRGLLPDEVIAPRAIKTGTLSDYARRAFNDVVPSLRALGNDPILAQLGIVNPKMLARVIDYAADGHADLYLRSGLLATLHAEHWLRARAAGAETVPTLAREPAGV
jgi:hypothetical protein